jgi:hypothetical protein
MSGVAATIGLDDRPLRAVVLVEGDSDRMALCTLADRRGRDLDAEGVHVVAMGGITNTRAFASHYGPLGMGVPLAGLYDAPAQGILQRGLAAAGLDAALEADALAGLGFHRCSQDLEDELIRALGVRSGRKARYAQLLVEALQPGRVPEPLAAVLAWIRATGAE